MDKNKLKILWEDNPDTPITSSVLSNIADVYSNYGGIIYKSNLTSLESGVYSDEKLKIRANSRIKFEECLTRASFFVDGSVVSHDSKFSPIEMDSIIFNTDFNGDRMIYMSEGAQNLITNSSFEEGLNYGWISKCTSNDPNHTLNDIPEVFDPIWGEEFNAITGVVEVEYGSHAFRMFTGAFGRVQLERSFDLTGSDIVSLSFSYKNNKAFKYYIICNNAGMNQYWNGNIWSNTVYFFTVPAPVEQQTIWSIEENVAINLDSLGSYASDVQLFIYSETPYTEVLLDKFQIENHAYVSSYSEELTSPTILTYSKQLIDLEKGLLDFSFYPRTKQDFVLLSVNTLSQIGRPAFEIKYQASEDNMLFRVFDVDTNRYVEVNNYVGLSQIIRQNKYLRLICNWDKDVGITCILNSNKLFSRSTDSYTPYTPNDIADITVGYQDNTLYANSYLKQLKVNSLPKRDEEILLDINNDIKIDPIKYRIGHVLERDINLEYTYEPNSRYYLYGVDDGNEQTISLELTQERIVGNRYYGLIGGFFTDDDAQVIESSIWDVVSRKFQTLHVDRFEVQGHDSPTYAVSIRTSPVAEADDIRSTIPFHTTSNIYGRHPGDELNLNVPYFELNSSGWLGIDNIEIDGNRITTRNYEDDEGFKNNDLEITVTDEEGVGLPKIWIHAPEIVVQSGNKDVKIDDIRIDNNYIYTAPGRSLHVDVSLTDDIDSVPTNNNIFFKSYDLNFHSTHDTIGLAEHDLVWDIRNDVDFNVYNDFKVDTDVGDIYLNGMKFTHNGLENIEYIKNGGDLSIYSDIGNVNLYAGTEGVLNLEDFKIKRNRLYRDTGDIEIDCPGTLYLGLKSIHVNPFDPLKAYGSGQYMIYDGDLYRSVMAIAAGTMNAQVFSSTISYTTNQFVEGPDGHIYKAPANIPAAAWNVSKWVKQWNNQLFITNTTYSIGEYVKYNGLLYQAKVVKAINVAWDSNNWTLLSEELNQQTRVCVRANEFIIDSNSIEFNNIDASTFIRFDDIKIKQSNLYTENLKPINIIAASSLNEQALAGDINFSTVSNIVMQETGGNFLSYVRSKYTKDLLVTNVIFNHSTVTGNAEHDLKMTQVGNDFRIDVRSGKRLVIENGVFDEYSGLVNSGDLMFIMDTSGITIDKDLVVRGNLTILGDSTVLDVGTVSVEDAIITLSSGVTTTPEPWSGIEIYRGTSPTMYKAALYWHEGRQKWCVDNAENIQEDITPYQQAATITNRSGMHPILYDGYSNDFDNVNIVSSNMTGFKMENNYSVAGFELVTKGDGGDNLPGKSVVRFGFHMARTDSYIPNKTGYEAQSIGMWEEIDTTSGMWSWIYEAAGNSSAHKIADLNNVGNFRIDGTLIAGSDITTNSGNIISPVDMVLSTAGQFEIKHGAVTTQIIDTSNNVKFAGELKAKDLQNIKTGSNVFKGNNASQKIAHGLTDINGNPMRPRFVGVTPSADPSGYLGEIWYTADTQYIEVRNSGTATTTFTWMAF
jgi:hypothetical protein